jgi:uncharacterized protein YyaL (SSP411 family)
VSEARTAHRLRDEKSPYLLQHAHNPVDWYPWGEEAFARARERDSPNFHSIGYATCHWCHVMERESFEDERVAALLNEDFVAIKVDREERPDVDRVYMAAMQALGLGGGWPLNVFLTPALEPFSGGTYFPPDARGGRPGMVQLLPHVAHAWREKRAEIVEQGAALVEALAAADAATAPADGAPAAGALADAAFAWYGRAWDRDEGGFGRAPKFPTPSNLLFLLRHGERRPEARATAHAIVRSQLDAMAARGLRDHLGGGFHRYSVDRHWAVPHFEKMLYDQAQLALAYVEAFRIERRAEDAAVARDVFAYVARDLTGAHGAFLSAEDADSEGEEGRFYVWTPAELERVLGADDAALAARRWGVTATGNFEHGATVLWIAATVDELAGELGLDAAEVSRRLESIRARLFDARSARPRPLLDDKVLAAWNGMMIEAFAHGAIVLDDSSLARTAERAGAFVWGALFDARTRALARRWRDGQSAGAGQLDDYAFLARGFVDLHEATGDPVWLERAVRLVEGMVERFWDDEEGGFFESPAGDASIRVRMKGAYDGAELAGNSIALWLLASLGTLCDRPDWRARAARTGDAFRARIAEHPAAMPALLVALPLVDRGPRQVVVAGTRGAIDTEALLAVYRRSAGPDDRLLVVGEGEDRERVTSFSPWAAEHRPIDGRAAAYVCEDGACLLPTTDPAAFAASLAAPRAAPDPS